MLETGTDKEKMPYTIVGLKLRINIRVIAAVRYMQKDLVEK